MLLLIGLLTFGGVSMVTDARPRRDCRGHRPTMHGTRNPDVIVGTDSRDVITSGRGADLVIAGAGRDLVCAGGGNDVISGGYGLDIGRGGRGQDRCINVERRSSCRSTT